MSIAVAVGNARKDFERSHNRKPGKKAYVSDYWIESSSLSYDGEMIVVVIGFKVNTLGHLSSHSETYRYDTNGQPIRY